MQKGDSVVDRTETEEEGFGERPSPDSLPRGLTLLHREGIRYSEVGEHLVLDGRLQRPGEALLLGRGQELFDRPLTDHTLSASHLKVVCLQPWGEPPLSGGSRTVTGVPGVYSVHDCGSKNGTYLLRRTSGLPGASRVLLPVDRQGRLLQPGDIIRAGRLYLEFEPSLPVGGGERVHFWKNEKNTAPMLSCSLASRELLLDARRLAQREVSFVLLEGETGTGKELVAKFLAHSSARSGPYVTYSLATGFTDSNLILAELFGYKKGAFNGADKDHDGLFAVAHRGILFLDELQDATDKLQSLLLRAVDPGEIRPLGANRPLQVDVQLITATSTPLEELEATGRLRSDLRGRIQQVLHLLPLRWRAADLVGITLYKLHESHGCQRKLHTELLTGLLCHMLPGNTRKLGEILESLLKANEAYPDDELMLAGARQHSSDELTRVAPCDDPRLGALVDLQALADGQKEAACREMVARCAGNKSLAARELGVSRKTLYKWLGLEDTQEASSA